MALLRHTTCTALGQPMTGPRRGGGADGDGVLVPGQGDHHLALTDVEHDLGVVGRQDRADGLVGVVGLTRERAGLVGVGRLEGLLARISTVGRRRPARTHHRPTASTRASATATMTYGALLRISPRPGGLRAVLQHPHRSPCSRRPSRTSPGRPRRSSCPGRGRSPPAAGTRPGRRPRSSWSGSRGGHVDTGALDLRACDQRGDEREGEDDQHHHHEDQPPGTRGPGEAAHQKPHTSAA